MGLSRKVRRVYREEGPVSLTRHAITYGVNQLRHRIRELGWRLRGERTFTVEGIETTFRITSLTEARGLRFLAGHEEPILAAVLSELSPDDVFFDVGANVGYFTCFAAAALDPESVIAFEPHRPTVDRLWENLARNGRTARVLPIALADESGTARIDGTARAAGFPFASIAGEHGDAEEIDLDTGDRLVAEGAVPHPTVIKIDVEGAEGLVVAGLRETLADDRCRLVYCEVHREADHRPRSIADFGGSEEDLRATFDDLGFEVSVLLDRGAEVYLKAER